MSLVWLAAAVLARSLPVHAAEAPPAPVVKPVEETICSLNVVDWDLAKTLRLLSEQTGANLVLLSAPGAKLTMRLQDVPLREMIRHLCAVSGVSSLKVGGTYVFASDAQLKAGYPAEYATAHPDSAAPPAPLARVTRTFRTSYVSSDQLATTLIQSFPKEVLSVVRGPEVASPSLGSVSVTANAVTGIETVHTEGHDRQQEDRSRMLLLSGPSDVVDQALSMARLLDVPRPQAVIDVSVLETTNEAVRDAGVQWEFGDINVSEKTNASSTSTGATSSASHNLGIGQFVRSPITATATIAAQQLKNRSRVLANPSISVLDGESAYVLIGSRIKYTVLQTAATPTSAPVYDVREEKVGIYLQVAATIASDGSVTLNLYPQVSTVTGYLNVNGSNLPQISTREARTVLRLRSGESIVMGGLIQDEDVNHYDKVPLLGDIPVLGEFFRHRRKSKVATQIVLTITPRIVSGPSGSGAAGQ